MEKNMKNSEHRILTIYFDMCMYFAIATLLVSLICIYYSSKLGILVLILSLIFFIIAFILKKIRYKGLYIALNKLCVSKINGEVQFFNNLEIPFVAINLNGDIICGNKKFYLLSNKINKKCNICNVFSELKKEIFVEMFEETKDNIIEKKLDITFEEKKLIVHIFVVPFSKFDSENEEQKIFDNNEKIFILYFDDITELENLKQKYDNEKNVIGNIYVDNYEEVTENMEDSKASMLMAMVDRRITRYIANNGAVLKKIEKDKYFFVTTKSNIEDMIKDKFSILDQVKEIIGGNNLAITLSVGVGYEGKSIETNLDYSRIALDMALGRGGDQVTIKKGGEFLFYGGKSASTSTNVSVRVRVKATSFRELLNTKEQVLIVGHNNVDLDAFGASIGVYVMAKFLSKRVFIVENNVTNAVEEMRNRFINSDAFDKNMFINGDTALNMIDKDTLLVMVDHNTNSISDEPRLLEQIGSAVIFDHHRVSTSTNEQLIMSYIETSSSSTCEMIADMLQYFDDSIKLKILEAESMLSGIMLDTKSFTHHCSAKTFEVASYLKKNGADIDRIRKVFRNDYKTTKEIMKIISNAEFYKNAFAISIVDNNDIDDVSVVAAKAANALIDIKGVKASVVIYEVSDMKYCLSSRSIDEVNVQVLMEKLGGGGHRGSAGATINAYSMEEVLDKLKVAIDSMIEEKEVK